jgi:hypothetical protein
MSAGDKVGMIVVDGVRYRPEEARALELEATEVVAVVDPYAEAAAVAKAQAEADAAELEQLRAASTDEAREKAAKDAAELEDLRVLASDPERLKAKLDELAAAKAAPAGGAVTTAAAQPANKARQPRGKGA